MSSPDPNLLSFWNAAITNLYDNTMDDSFLNQTYHHLVGFIEGIYLKDICLACAFMHARGSNIVK